MGELPWQVAYGQWIGWTAAAVLIVLGALAVWLLARRRAHRSRDAARRGLNTPTTVAVAGPCVLRGHIEVPGGTVPSIDSTGASAACTIEASRGVLSFKPHPSGARTCLRAPLLNLKLPSGTLPLRAPVRVVAGTHERLRRRLSRMDSADREQLLAEPDGSLTSGTPWPKRLRVPGVIRIVRHGDEVILRGVVRGADEDPEGSALELAAGTEGLIEVATAEPGSVSFDKPALVARALAAGLLLAFSVGWGAGAFAVSIGDARSAALFPQHRAWAIDTLFDQAVRTRSPGLERVREQLAYEALRQDCRSTGATMLRAGMWEAAGETLARCGEPEASRLAAGAYATAGLFDKACEALRTSTDASGETGRLEARLFLLGSCGAEASAALRRYAAWFDANGKPADPQRFPVKARVRAIGCVADAIDAQAGDDAALRRLSVQKEEECRLCYAALGKGKSRLDALAFLNDASLGEKQALQRHPMLRDVLTAAAGGEPSFVFLPSIPTATALLRGTPPWTSRAHALESELLDTLAVEGAPLPHRRSLRCALATRAAIFELLAGDTDQAGRLLDVARSDTRAMEVSPAERLRMHAQLTTIRVLASILAGDADRARSAIDAWEIGVDSFLREVAPEGTDDAPARLDDIRRQVVPMLIDARALVAAAQGAKFSPEADGFALAVSTQLNPSAPVGADMLQPLRGGSDKGLLKMLDTSSRPALAMLVAPRMSTGRDDLRRWLQAEKGRELRLDWAGEGDSAGLFTEALFSSTLFARTAAILELSDIESKDREVATRFQAALSQHAIAVPWAAMSEL